MRLSLQLRDSLSGDDADAEISPRTIRAIQAYQQRGGQFILATGRDWSLTEGTMRVCAGDTDACAVIIDGERVVNINGEILMGSESDHQVIRAYIKLISDMVARIPGLEFQVWLEATDGQLHGRFSSAASQEFNYQSYNSTNRFDSEREKREFWRETRMNMTVVPDIAKVAHAWVRDQKS